jgi:NADP-dependent 3-hydroxy acid dehydrogenase YdfG
VTKTEPALPGLPEPPPLGTAALPAGTFEGTGVVVTGGGTGLGLAIAVEFARLGADLVIASRKPEHLEHGEAVLRELGGRVIAVTCDIREPEQIAAAFDAAAGSSGPPRVLVNNAAANFPVPAEDMSPNAWRTVVDITLNGTFFCAREFARRHLTAGTSASIVNVGASYAWTGGPGFAHSAAAKAGVKNMVETLAVEWGPYGIQVRHQGQPVAHHREGCVPARAACRPPARAGLGGDVPGLSLRAFHLGSHARGRRSELAAPQSH